MTLNLRSNQVDTIVVKVFGILLASAFAVLVIREILRVFARAKLNRALKQLSTSNDQIDTLLETIDEAAFKTYLSVVNQALTKQENGPEDSSDRSQELSQILQDLNARARDLKRAAGRSDSK